MPRNRPRSAVCEKAPKEEKDIQLQKAIDVLNHWDSFKIQLAKNGTEAADQP